MNTNSKQVYSAIANVTANLAKEGISKDRKNTQQGYSFRGIDDVYNALAPFLAQAKLCILPRVESREVVERESQKGGALFYVTVKVDFAFVSAEDSSEHHVVTYGEAMDSGDKATNKAMSAAYKYACMQAFCIPTEGDNDADAKPHDVKPMHKSVPADVWESMSEGTQKWLQGIADSVRAELEAKGGAAALKVLEEQDLDADHKVAIWSRFSSSERASMKPPVSRKAA